MNLTEAKISGLTIQWLIQASVTGGDTGDMVLVGWADSPRRFLSYPATNGPLTAARGSAMGTL
jgi:hypothetical protein